MTNSLPGEGHVEVVPSGSIPAAVFGSNPMPPPNNKGQDRDYQAETKILNSIQDKLLSNYF